MSCGSLRAIYSGGTFGLEVRAPAAQYRKADEVTSDTGEPKAE